MRPDSGSFRDRDGRVYYENGRVLRALSADAKREWDALRATAFFARFVGRRRLIPTTEHPAAVASIPGQWAAVLEHQRVPFVSYPYEWSFGMLKDAGLLQLDLLSAALDEGMALIDGSAYNTQWLGAVPVFIDIPSLRALKPGQPWVGYRQFCQMFLYPLMLQAYKDVGFHAWLRGRLEGIDPAEMNRLMSARDRFRRGVFPHVYLHSTLQSRYAATTADVRRELRDSGFNREMIKVNVRKMRAVVAALRWQAAGSAWSEYTKRRSYTGADLERKKDFVRQVVAARRWTLVWDLGCNTGEFSELAAANADYVVATDSDHLAVDLFYRRLTESRIENILPLVNNLADPSAGLGWRGAERQGMAERGRPELTLCLALIHHAVIGANIPLDEFIEWLAATTTRTLVIEFVTRDDPMVRRLLLNKEDKFSDYDPEHFERCLARRFRVVRRDALESGTRVLYVADRH